MADEKPQHDTVAHILAGGFGIPAEGCPACDPYETAEFSCPYDGTELVAPWQKCPRCGRND